MSHDFTLTKIWRIQQLYNTTQSSWACKKLRSSLRCTAWKAKVQTPHDHQFCEVWVFLPLPNDFFYLPYKIEHLKSSEAENVLYISYSGSGQWNFGSSEFRFWHSRDLCYSSKLQLFFKEAIHPFGFYPLPCVISAKPLSKSVPLGEKKKNHKNILIMETQKRNTLWSEQNIFSHKAYLPYFIRCHSQTAFLKICLWHFSSVKLHHCMC